MFTRFMWTDESTLNTEDKHTNGRNYQKVHAGSRKITILHIHCHQQKTFIPMGLYSGFVLESIGEIFLN